MKSMKKLVSLFLCGALAVSAFGCEAKSEKKDTTKEDSKVETEEKEETSPESEETETEATEASSEESQTEKTTEATETEATTTTEATEPEKKYFDFSNLYGRSSISSRSGSKYYEKSGMGEGSVVAGDWGVYIFPENYTFITEWHEQQSMIDPEETETFPDYKVSYPVIDNGIGYEFKCTICYPDIVSSEGSLSGKKYELIEAEESDPNEGNPHVRCTYLAEDGKTYRAGNLLSADEESCIYDEDGNPCFAIFENVTVLIPYDLAGDFYDKFIKPAMDGTITQFGYSIANCYKLRFDEHGIMSVMEFYKGDHMGYWKLNEPRFEGMAQLYVVRDEYVSEYYAPDIEVLFDAPYSITDTTGEGKSN